MILLDSQQLMLNTGRHARKKVKTAPKKVKQAERAVLCEIFSESGVESKKSKSIAMNIWC